MLLIVVWQLHGTVLASSYHILTERILLYTSSHSLLSLSLQATTLGAFMSLCAIGVMGILFLSETLAFARTIMGTSIALDENDQPQIRLNFNITLMDLHCDFVSVDVWDTLGTNRQNVTKNLEKWQLDESGQRRIFSGRNREQREVQHEEHEETLEELHEDGEQAIELTPETFAGFLEQHEMAFIDMYAP